MEEKYRTQEFGYFEILDQAWGLYRRGFASFLLIVMLVYLPLYIVLYIFNDRSATSVEVTTASLALDCLVYLVEFGVPLVAFVAVAYLVEEMVQGRSTNPFTALRISLSRWPIVFIGNILFVIAIVFGTLLLIIPGIIIAVYLVFTPTILALRKVGLHAFQYSIDMVKGQWWRVLGVYLGIGIPIFVINYLITRGVQYFLPNLGIGVVLLDTISILVTFLFQIMVVVFFLNQDYHKHPIESETVIPQVTGELPEV